MHRWLAERYAREGRWLNAASELTKAAARGEVGAAADLLPHLGWRLRRTLGLRAAASRASSDGCAATAAAWLREFEDIEESTGA
jgi:hypothetical protein